MREISKILYSINVKIFDYIDFRDYLSQVLQQLRENSKNLTYRKLSSEFGFKSPNFLLLLIQKKRKMSIETAQKLASQLQLNKTEKEYFLLMVKSTLVNDVAERELITKRMLQIQRGLHQKNIEPKLYELYENWYQVILREILNLQQTPQTTVFLASFFDEKVSEK